MKYKNGLTSVLIDNKYSLTGCVAVFVQVGSVDEKPHQAGLSHFLEHLMFNGSKNYRDGCLGLLCNNIENIGGYINACTSKEYTMYYITIQRNGIESSIEMLADTVQNPLFPQNEIDMERKVVIEEIQRNFDDPVSVLYEKFYEIIYNGKALKNAILGTSQVIESVSRDEMLDYHKMHYVPEKMIVVVSGDFDMISVDRLIRKTFGKFKRETVLEDPLFVEKVCEGKDIVTYGKVEIGYMFTGFLGPGTNEEDIYLANLAVKILGGKSSKLYRVLCDEKHLVYSMDSCFITEKGGGNICIMSTFDPKYFEEIKNEITKQIENIINGGVTENELNRAKLLIKTDWNFSLETPYDIASINGYWHLMGNPEFVTKYIKKVESFNVSDIFGFFKKYYSPLTISNVALLPKVDNGM
ncbi:MAG: insulinase family protein [Endomicrobium sp.]|jgi:zinc protease|nr:insulinase family protein [Endomicrobium sp.]